jgi:hypothetical protein
LKASLTTEVNHVACPNPECSSSDGYSVDPKTGWGKCFVCNYKVPPKGIVSNKDKDISERGVHTEHVTPLTDVFREINHRSISKEAVKKYQIDVVLNNEKVEARYPYFKNGVHVANKIRTKDKKFYWEGERDNVRSVELYGQHLFPTGSARQITLVEGEYDAPACLDFTWQQVSRCIR